MEHPADPQQRARHREPADRHALRRPRPAGRRGAGSAAAEPQLIDREDGSRHLDVGADFEGRDLGAVAKDLAVRLKGVEFARGYHAEVLGEYQERQAAQGQLLATAVLAAAAILLLLQASFGAGARP